MTIQTSANRSGRWTGSKNGVIAASSRRGRPYVSASSSSSARCARLRSTARTLTFDDRNDPPVARVESDLDLARTVVGDQGLLRRKHSPDVPFELDPADDVADASGPGRGGCRTRLKPTRQTAIVEGAIDRRPRADIGIRSRAHQDGQRDVERCDRPVHAERERARDLGRAAGRGPRAGGRTRYESIPDPPRAQGPTRGKGLGELRRGTGSAALDPTRLVHEIRVRLGIFEGP